jgi:hypothetical protein
MGSSARDRSVRDRRPWRRRLLVAAVVTVLAAGGVFLGDSARHTEPGQAAAAAVQIGPAPWPPETRSLRRRLHALGLPGPSDTVFHIHALLRVFVDGRPVPVPAGIGIDPGGRFLAPLHTHDASGIVHVEADRRYSFTLGQLFTVWGLRLTDHQLGGYADRRDRRLQVFVNGVGVRRPASYVIHAHAQIVVGFGRPGSFPVVDATPFPAGL